MSNNPKILRQLELYENICRTIYHGPDELMGRFNINRRTLQRDLKDLRDAGIINLVLDKKHNNYVESKKDAVFDETATGRHREHLVRLNRLVTLMDKLPRTDVDALRHYETALEEYKWYKYNSKKDPIEYPPEYIGEPPIMPVLEDVRTSYYSLFPDSNERKRQRDFQALREIGYDIYYSRKYHVFIFDYPYYYE